MKKTIPLYIAVNIAKIAYHGGPEGDRPGLLAAAYALADHCSFPYRVDAEARAKLASYITGASTNNPYAPEKPA